MASHIFFLDASTPAIVSCTACGILRRSPCPHFSVAILGDRDRRLHGNVRQVRSVVFGLENLSPVFALWTNAASTSPTLRTTLPGCREVASSVLRNGAELYTECGLLLIVPFDLQPARPLNAARVLSAITATPPKG